MPDVNPPARILVVDDDPGVLRLVDRALKREKFFTATAGSGKAALGWLARNTADLMLLDLKLQDTEGKELIQQLAVRGRTVPFIIITGQGDERVAVEMMKRGALDYLVKDVQFIEFIPTVVRRALDQLAKGRRLAEAEEALRGSEERYRTLFNTLIEGFCIIEVIFDADDRPVDYRFLEVNPAFEQQTGLANVQGRLMRDLIPTHETQWFETYGRIALTGEPARFVREARGLNRWYDVSAYRLGGRESRKVAILFNDITERRRLESELLETADREQRRIGHDLHDGLGQQLTALEMKSFLLLEDLAAADLAASREGLREHARQISKALRECITTTRSIARGLAPMGLKPDGLTGALEELSRLSRVPGKVDCRFSCRSPVILEDSQASMHLYRITQEAVNNALKHARARCIQVSLERVAGELRLQINDDGRGLPQRGRSGSGMGLEVMRHRAQVIGASLEIASTRGGGVSVSCTLPLKEP